MLSNYEYGVPVNACSLMYSACLKCLGLVCLHRSYCRSLIDIIILKVTFENFHIKGVFAWNGSYDPDPTHNIILFNDKC